VPALVHSMTHAWVQTGQPWIDEGLAQFMGLLWTEQQQGREAAVAQLVELERPVALAEPAFVQATSGDADPVGQPLIVASDEMYYRRKAAAVWWMLRGIVGDQPLAAALTTLAEQPASLETGYVQALAFETLLEKISGKDLKWFFNDWVLRDRGLPDLTIADVAPRQLPAGQGHDSGWLVAVTVRNDGAAAAEVPVVIRSGTFSTTKRIRIAGFSSATDRVLVEAPPTQVLVNDGSTPEVRSSTHSEAVVLKTP
jgi:aminopeptidase N